MGRLMRHENGLLMDLQTTLPDGTVITTPWPEGRRFILSAQLAHADEHRRNVRYGIGREQYAASFEVGAL